MISVLLYGRNDSHGYNLHKRAAISLNAISAVLTDPDDEILFVDCNTPDGMPTFPEAIADTLTERARRLLRIFRITPEVFERHSGDTHLPVLEPLARNVALRRSNPANRWVLSTNTDMIFVVDPTYGSLSDAVATLPDGFYGLPRFEVPESLWESLDRRDPRAAIERIGRWGKRLHLDEIVLSNEMVRYDGPGDFQLMLRDQIVAMDGFDERMIYGWHVDSNLCRRFGFVAGAVSSFEDRCRGYHCTHTRQVGISHRSGTKSNDLATFVDSVEQAAIPDQRETWGLVSEVIPELHLDDGPNGLEAVLEKLLPGRVGEPDTISFAMESFDHHLLYNPYHRFPYLADALWVSPPQTTVGYVGAHDVLLGLLADYLVQRGQGDRLLICRDVFRSPGHDGAALEAHPAVELTDVETIAARANVFVLDACVSRFHASKDEPGYPNGSDEARAWRRRFAAAVVDVCRAEHARITAGRTRRRFLQLAGVHTWFHQIALELLDTHLSPLSAGVRPGFVKERPRFVRALRFGGYSALARARIGLRWTLGA